MKRVRFVMIGGFLGAGKTTTLARLAKFYQSRGQKVGLVTNDQAQDLVDTHSLRSQGLPVEEIAGACFCCRFDDLVCKVETLNEAQPDVILAEPVGSCTDLVATVVQPLKDLYGSRFEVAPYPVLFKPSHGLRILRNEGAGFSPKAAYIFRKQLEEADCIVVNRLDELSPADRKDLAALMTQQFSTAPLLWMSAKTGDGFGALTEFIDQEGNFGQRILDIDYDIYAEGEAELGWLNSSFAVRSSEAFALDDLLLDVVKHLQGSLARKQAEVAHLKAIGLSDESFGVANLVSSLTGPELSLASRGKVKESDVIVNARVALDPAELEEEVKKTIAAVCQERRAKAEFRKTASFRPGRPQPTHRYATAKT
ncbi:MAG: cobalamin biosynthesis protein P47K [Gemmataceae bacterium]|nr:cobalamin biosynthesis protein P47K [Gemmataceae bacterium]